MSHLSLVYIVIGKLCNIEILVTLDLQLRALGFLYRAVASTLHLTIILEKMFELRSEGSVCITS